MTTQDDPLGRRVQQHQHDPEEQQRGAQVALEHQHADRQPPGHQQRAEVARRGSSMPRNRRPGAW